jgi:glycosyltransferase involved in cell wall biosynthesis
MVSNMIIMLIPKVEPSQNGIIVGGSVNTLLTLVKGLQNKLWVSKIITSMPSNRMAIFERVRPDHMNFEIIRNDYYPQTVGFGITFLLRVLIRGLKYRRKKVPIVHGHSGYAIYCLATYLFSLISGSASIHTLYCPINRDATVDNKKKVVLSGGLAVYFLKKLDRIAVMSQNIAQSLLEAGIPKRKVVIMPTAVDTLRFNPLNDGSSIRLKFSIPESTPVVLYVGNLMLSKGLHVLIKAFSLVVGNDIDSRLIITLELKHADFDDRYQKIRGQIDKLGIGEKFIQLGTIADMPSLMAASDVVVAPYLNTQGPSDYPLAIMEAMSSGKCIIGTRVGGIPELIEDKVNGLLVSPGSETELASALSAVLLSNAIREKYGKAARRTIEKRFSMDQVAETHINVFLDMINSKK